MNMWQYLLPGRFFYADHLTQSARRLLTRLVVAVLGGVIAIIAFALRSVRQPGPVNQYEAAQYPRFGPVRYGAARQIPAAELERVRRQQETQNAQQ